MLYSQNPKIIHKYLKKEGIFMSTMQQKGNLYKIILFILMVSAVSGTIGACAKNGNETNKTTTVNVTSKSTSVAMTTSKESATMVTERTETATTATTATVSTEPAESANANSTDTGDVIISENITSQDGVGSEDEVIIEDVVTAGLEKIDFSTGSIFSSELSIDLGGMTIKHINHQATNMWGDDDSIRMEYRTLYRRFMEAEKKYNFKLEQELISPSSLYK
jgi:hypothetical protein